MITPLMVEEIPSRGTYNFYFVFSTRFPCMNLYLYLSWVLNLSRKYIGTQKKDEVLRKAGKPIFYSMCAW